MRQTIVIVLVLTSLLLGGCDTLDFFDPNTANPSTGSNERGLDNHSPKPAFSEAHAFPRDETIQIVEVPKPVLIPGQLQKRPIIEETLPKERAVVGLEAVKQANRTGLKTPKSGDYFNAMMVFEYMEGAMYEIFAAPGRITDIAFEHGEQILSVGAGDTKRWQLIKTESGEESLIQQHIFLKPLKENLTNSLVVTTNKRTYHIVLRSFKETFMASVSWNFPKLELQRFIDEVRAEKTRKVEEITGHINPETLKFGYEISLSGGSKPPWMPTLAFNDGKKTYIRMAAETKAYDAPLLFIYGTEGSQIVNFRIKGNYYIVDRLFSLAELRSGQKNQIIVKIEYEN